ncbi:hypothetical protein GCM10027062_04760 [Nocardioides hungaricus]
MIVPAVLSVATVVVLGRPLLDGGDGSSRESAVAESPVAEPDRPVAGTRPALGAGAAPPTERPERRPERQPVVVPQDGPGTFTVVPAAVRRATPDHAYSVEIESGLDLAPGRTAGLVDAILADGRGWSSQGHSFARVDQDPELRILVATPATTDELCAPLQTRGRVSCRNGALVVLNAIRWTEGIPDYRGDLLGYRRYLVNHEVGHALGRSHVSCPGAGQPAPVMMQQSYGLAGCRKNAWP